LAKLSANIEEQIGRSLVLICLLVAPGLYCLRAAVVSDPDMWWHMRYGEWILAHHAFVPRIDMFSNVGVGKCWTGYSWLFDVVLEKLYQQWNLVGVVIYTTTISVTIAAALYHLMRRQKADPVVGALIVLGVMAILSRLIAPRPWLFSILFFALELDIVLEARRTGKRRGLLWLPVIFVLWANTHILFVLGLLVLGAAAVEPLAERWWPWRETKAGVISPWLTLAACVLACMVNPIGWDLYRTAYVISRQSGILDLISEMSSLSFRSYEDFLLLFLVLLTAGAMGWNRRLPFFETVLLAAAAFISFRSRRDLWFVAVAAGAILASQLPRMEKEFKRLTNVAVLAVLLVTAGVLWAGGRLFEVNNASLETLVQDNLPVNAVEFMRKMPNHGPIFNDFNWGGYLIWSLREPVSIDSRGVLYGDEWINRNIETWSGRPDWSTDPNLKAAKIVMGPKTFPLCQILKLDPEFHLAYEDKLADVFVRQ